MSYAPSKRSRSSVISCKVLAISTWFSAVRPITSVTIKASTCLFRPLVEVAIAFCRLVASSTMSDFLSLLYNPGHSQGSPCLLGSHDAATQGPNETSVPGTRTPPKNEDTAIQVIPHGRCLRMTLWNAYACAWVAPLIRPSDYPNRLCGQW